MIYTLQLYQSEMTSFVNNKGGDVRLKTKMVARQKSDFASQLHNTSQMSKHCTTGYNNDTKDRQTDRHMKC